MEVLLPRETDEGAMMIDFVTFIEDTVHLTIGPVFLVLDNDAFVQALKRGKALRRAQALQAREDQMHEAAERKRQERSHP